MVTALKHFKLSGRDIAPGVVLDGGLWTGLTKRCRDVLTRGRYVADATRVTDMLGPTKTLTKAPAKRGRPKKEH